jgi:HAD superfamily hydrolase (TIGR01509 family)
MTGSNFNAVIFDSNGVLVDAEILGVEIEIAALSEIGLVFNKAEFVRRFMCMNDTEFMRALNVEAHERIGTGLPHDFAERVVRKKDNLYRTALQAVPGIERLLASLTHPKAVASSASVWELERNLTLTGLIDQFSPHVYSADVVAVGKPAPDIFVHAAHQLNVPTHGCLVIEDSVNGVTAGLAAGMTVWGFIGGGHASDMLGAQLMNAGAHAILEQVQIERNHF